jgi:Family of unknown function (DUF6695)
LSNTGKLIVLAYPDTFVTMSTEWICKVLPLFGLGTKEYIKAGHAALVLVENNTGNARYFDFGRYITPEGHGRVRGANTDAELHMPITAKISVENNIENLEEFLLWLDANPQKTHGEGRLLASVCDTIDFQKAEEYIVNLQNEGSIPYGAFNKKGSNCARFVTDTILAATTDNKIKKALYFNKKFTPSTVGNVEIANTLLQKFQVYNGQIELFNGSALKENLTNYFHKKNTKNESLDAILNAEKRFSDRPQLQKLEGTGSSAWFEVTETTLPTHHFSIKRYNDRGEEDYHGVYVSTAFDPSKPYQFTYDSHCAFCHILQQGKKIKLESVGTLEQFSSLQKQRSA